MLNYVFWVNFSPGCFERPGRRLCTLAFHVRYTFFDFRFRARFGVCVVLVSTFLYTNLCNFLYNKPWIFLIFQQTVGQWQKVFWISSGWLFLTGFLYIIFSKSELQPWNSPATTELLVIDRELKRLDNDVKIPLQSSSEEEEEDEGRDKEDAESVPIMHENEKMVKKENEWF